MRTLFRSLILIAAAATAACSDAREPVRPRARPASSLHGEFTIRNRRTGDVDRLVFDGGRATQFRNGMLLLELRADSLVAHRGGRSYAFAVRGGSRAGGPRGDTPSLARGGLSLDGEAYLMDPDLESDDAGCLWEASKVIATAGAVMVAVDVAVAAAATTGGTVTPAMIVAIYTAVDAYGHAVGDYRKCRNKSTTDSTTTY